MAKQNQHKGGDCYEVAGRFALDGVKKVGSRPFVGTPHVVHAEVGGQGAIKGVRYGHAWIEDDEFVYDYSNGREIILPKEFYHKVGQVKLVKPKFYKYTFQQARHKMAETGHFGCWDLKTESGL